MSIRKLRAGRVPSVTAAQYVGEKGTLFWNESTGEIRLSDGTTVGGLPVAVSFATASHAGSIKPGPGFTIATDGTLGLKAGPSFYLDETDTFRLRAGTDTQIGGVKSGNGIVIASDGTINIDTEGLSFAFGDFYAFTNTGPHDGACLSTVNANQDLNLVSNGTGMVNVVGAFHVHTTNEDAEGALSADPVFKVDPEGKTTASALDIKNTLDLGFVAPLNVSSNADGLTRSPSVLGGAVVQFTGRDDLTSAVVHDMYGVDATRGTGGKYVFRAARGTNATPAALQTGDIVGQVVAAGWAATGQYGGYDVGGLRIVANDNYTATARGSKLELFVTAAGTITQSTIATIDSTGIVMSSGKVLTGTATAANKVNSALTAGYGLKLSSGTTYDGSTAVTLNKYDAITSAGATGSGANGWTYSLDLGTANGTVIVDAGGNFSGTVTITGTPIVGKLVRLLVIGGLKGATTVTVSGLTSANSTNGTNVFAATTGTASTQVVEFICTTTALSGVYMNLSGAK